MTSVVLRSSRMPQLPVDQHVPAQCMHVCVHGGNNANIQSLYTWLYHMSIRDFVHMSIHMSMYLSTHLCVHMAIHMPIRMSAYRSMHRSMHVYTRGLEQVYTRVCGHVYTLAAHMSIHISARHRRSLGRGLRQCQPCPGAIPVFTHLYRV